MSSDWVFQWEDNLYFVNTIHADDTFSIYSKPIYEFKRMKSIWLISKDSIIYLRHEQATYNLQMRLERSWSTLASRCLNTLRCLTSITPSKNGLYANEETILLWPMKSRQLTVQSWTGSFHNSPWGSRSDAALSSNHAEFDLNQQIWRYKVTLGINDMVWHDWKIVDWSIKLQIESHQTKTLNYAD